MRRRSRTSWRRALCGATLATGILLTLAGCGTDGATRFAGDTPTVIDTFGECAFCHRDLAAHMLETGGHFDLTFKCESCHDDLRPGDFGKGHRVVPSCLDCHTEQATHNDPGAGTETECQTCHTPHGSSNLFLVREAIRTPDGETRNVTFTNIDGMADESFASATAPGTGVCEICHTQTRHFRGDGTGSAHFRFPCFTCHPHSGGFEPR